MGRPADDPAQCGAAVNDGEQRRDELARNLNDVRQRIDRAAVDAGRTPSQIKLVVVTKTWPAPDVRLLASLGVTHVAENRHQEAAGKAAELVDLGLVWHFIGQLQTNKAQAVAGYAHVVESVDRLRLVAALDHGAQAASRQLLCLIQVSLEDAGDLAPARGGASSAEVLAVAAAIANAPALTLDGVMAVAPLGKDAAAAFDRLRVVAESVRAEHPAATTISAGMSGDLEIAVARGATHVRVGSAVLGARPPVG